MAVKGRIRSMQSGKGKTSLPGTSACRPLLRKRAAFVLLAELFATSDGNCACEIVEAAAAGKCEAHGRHFA